MKMKYAFLRPRRHVSIFLCKEQFENEEFIRGNYMKGSCQGLWWALVSMTTVGCA